ncbi:hypothetical protein CFOL_v3_28424 [Cephalotus follicularis]|uniref:Uncharacterized protein n=1 Tax=Cephalotus follicularis TaxID=3775 RepID=A0A1Q3CXN5_CEPFO|nr:hypothetical protein CFOL_v3_28424 [Cephalotus follicularis]
MSMNDGVGVRITPHPQPAKKGIPYGGRKIIIIRIALWNLGVGLLSKWNGVTFLFIDYILNINIVCRARLSICFTPRNSSSARLGQNSRASTSISSIAKMCSSDLYVLSQKLWTLGRINDCIFDALVSTSTSENS